VIRARGDRAQEFAGIENAIRLGQQIFWRDVEGHRRQPATVQPDVAGRFQELEKILNLERIAIAQSTKSTSTSTPVRPISQAKVSGVRSRSKASSRTTMARRRSGCGGFGEPICKSGFGSHGCVDGEMWKFI
jgi:hypothetical protein